MRRIPGFLGAAALAASGVLYAQSAALKPVEALPDPVRPVPAEVAYAHPLFVALDEPPKIVERPNPADLETRVPLVLAAHVLETGKVSELVAVEPPLKALATPLATLAPKWRYAPPKKGGQSVGTWAAQILDLNVSLEKGVFSAFQLEPVRKDDPIAKVFRESSVDDAMARYPAALDPKDEAAVSVEELDVRWVRESAAKWKLAPARSAGRPVAAWMTLDATLDYTIDSAKKKGERSLKKNLRATPSP